MSAISVTGLHKSFGDVHAVNGVSLEIDAGEVFALLGPNGAGKTTTIEMLEGYIKPDSGAMSVLGFDPRSATADYKNRIGIVLQMAGVDEELSIRELLTHFAGYYSNPRDPGEVIDLVGLSDKARARIKTLSGGQRRRFDLAAGIIGNPKLIFLDEPTTGFDPAARRSAWELIEGLQSAGTTILLTTHYLDEAQNLADRVAVIRAGKIVAEGDPDTLGGRDVAEARITFRLPDGESVSSLPVSANSVDHRQVLIETSEPTRLIHVLAGWAMERGGELDALQVHRPTLEDVYLELVGEEHQ